MRTSLRGFLLANTFLFLCACGGSSGGDDTPPEPTVIPAPSAATLIFPENNSACLEGEIINDARSNVTFEWNASQNTDTYVITLKNLISGNTFSQNSGTNQATLSLDRGTPYEWFIVSEADGTNETATSLTWRFYNEGPGIVNYAPFPALAVAPERGAQIETTTEVLLEWEGEDLNNDISSYEVFIDTDSNPSTSAGTTSDTSLSVNVVSGTVYYWKVVTTDSEENSSTSEIFEFRVM